MVAAVEKKCQMVRANGNTCTRLAVAGERFCPSCRCRYLDDMRRERGIEAPRAWRFRAGSTRREADE